jgi:hypothetical protein
MQLMRLPVGTKLVLCGDDGRRHSVILHRAQADRFWVKVEGWIDPIPVCYHRYGAIPFYDTWEHRFWIELEDDSEFLGVKHCFWTELEPRWQEVGF